MTITETDRAALAALEARVNALLPEEYQGAFDVVEPTPMGSAGLRFDADGRVAWDEIWGSFCDLAMAGGPPHKGRLLQPASREEIASSPGRYAEVVAEICRGVRLVADLEGAAAPDAGWIRVRCFNEPMAEWLLRAITMENVAVRAAGRAIDLPASPSYRLEKEIKNVITVVAKTCHYWAGHMPRAQQQAIGRLFETLDGEAPLVVPAAGGADTGRTYAALADSIRRQPGLPLSGHQYAGWLGVEVTNVRAAIWMMRALVVSNVLARREDTTLYVPVPAAADPDGRRVAETVTRVHHLARANGLL